MRKLKNIWYKFTCWAWKRYSTVKPRYLSHEWIDRDHLLLAVMFEVLSDFVEKEMQSEWGQSIDWDHDETHRNARDEILTLYAWWHDNKGFPEYEWQNDLSSAENFKREDEFNRDVLNKCKRLIDVSPYMWT